MKLSAVLNWKTLAGNRRLFLLCLFLFVVSSLGSFWIFFPADIVQRRLLQTISQQTGVDLRGDNASVLLPLGFELNLLVFPQQQGVADLKLRKLRITPVWSSLFSSDPKAHLEGELASGRFNAQGSQTGDFALQLENVDILTLQEPQLAYRLAGILSGNFQAEDMANHLNSGRGAFAFTLREGAILGLEKIGLPRRLGIGTLRLTGKFDQRRFSLEKVMVSGGALELSGGGNILLSDTPEKTRLNLNVRFQPTAATPDSLRELLKLTDIKPTTDGSYLVRIGGTLAKPVIR